MAVSSQDVIKSVSKKLKHYIDVKRLEDGFDLSGVDCPRLDHPPTKARPVLQYDGLHDRPLKHYFSPQNVKQILTHFKAPAGRSAREKEIRSQLERYLRRYDFAPSILSDGYYNHGKHSKKTLKPEACPGFGVGLKKRKSPHRGGNIPLRSVPTNNVGRTESDRLLGLASRLLATTEMIDVNRPPVRPESARYSDEAKVRGAPRSFENHRSGRHKIYTYDIHGRRMLVKPRPPPESEEDSAYHSPSPNYLTINGEPADQKVMPGWLRSEMRPHSSYGARRPTPPAEEPRPNSAMAPRPSHSRSSSEASIKPQPKKSWGADSQLRSPVSPKAPEPDHDVMSPVPIPPTPTRTTEAGIQTGGELLRQYDPMEQVLRDGEPVEFQVQVTTGTGLGSSTKAEVKIAFIGDKGRTEEIFLEDSSTHKIMFQKGQEDIFNLNTVYVGPVRKIAIGHDRQELGFGWYLTKVIVKDLNRLIQYVIPCERWLSARESDGRTFREFPVDYSTTFKPQEPPAAAPSQDSSPPLRPQPLYSPSSDGRTDQTFHTSLATVYSDRSERSKSDRGTPTRRPRSRSSSSTSFTSTSSYSSDDESSTGPLEDKKKEEVQEKPKEDEKMQEESKPKPAPAKRTIRRRDTFFDQKPVGPDYGSVIDNMSHTTEQDDSTDRQDDFKRNEPEYVPKDPIGKEMTLKEEDEETGVLKEEDVVDHEADRAEEAKTGARISMPDPPPPEVAKEVYLDGFKAGMEAAKIKHTIAVSDSDSSSTYATDSDSDSDSRLEAGKTIHEAAKQRDLARVKEILETFPEKKNETDERGWTPVHIAASIGDPELLKWLAVCNANLNVETPTNYTPIHLAAMHGHTNSMMILYAMGAKLSSNSVDHQTALHIAAMGGHLESVKWLVVNRVPLDTADNLGRTPCDLAEEYKHEEVASFLRSCQDEQARPGSSLSLIRSTSRQSIDRPSYTSPSGDASSDDEPPAWQNNSQATTPRGRSAIDVDAQSKKSIKHDEELMEKKQMYDEQQRRLSEKNVSFLDDIRNEAL